MSEFYEILHEPLAESGAVPNESFDMGPRQPKLRRIIAAIGVVGLAVASGIVAGRDNSLKQARSYKLQLEELESAQKRLHDDAYLHGMLLGEANERAFQLSSDLVGVGGGATDVMVWLGSIQRYKNGTWVDVCKDPIVLPDPNRENAIPAAPEYIAASPVYYGVFSFEGGGGKPAVLPATMQPGDRFVADDATGRRTLGTYPVYIRSFVVTNEPLSSADIGLFAIGPDGKFLRDSMGEITPGRAAG